MKQNITENFVNYWDSWHKAWYYLAKKWLTKNYPISPTDYIVNPIIIDAFSAKTLINAHDSYKRFNGWQIPFKNGNPSVGGNRIPAWQLFPEPYWGDPFSNQLKAIFLNLNPGEGGEGQRIIFGDNSILFRTYEEQQESYSQTIKILSKDPSYATTKIFSKKRAKQATNILKEFGADTEVSVEQILFFEFIPWHSKNIQDIPLSYLRDNCDIILNKILIPAAEISKTLISPLKNIILMRGDWLNKLNFITLTVYHFNDNIPEEKVILGCLKTAKAKWKVSYFKLNEATFICFSCSGGNNYPSNKKAIIAAIEYTKTK